MAISLTVILHTGYVYVYPSRCAAPFRSIHTRDVTGQYCTRTDPPTLAVISHVLRNSPVRRSPPMFTIFPRYAIARSSLWRNRRIIRQEWFFDNDRSISNARSRSILPHLPSCSRTLKQTMEVSLGIITYDLWRLNARPSQGINRPDGDLSGIHFCRWIVTMKKVAEHITDLILPKCQNILQTLVSIRRSHERKEVIEKKSRKLVWSKLLKMTAVICGNVDPGTGAKCIETF